ncbi:SET domain-containing protein [Naegleria gruberi]|uniref:SET domain-containing protein n=1 Tax=Naegleria gruberi TaxID=5762 RepID=D2V2B6_NAEGR|nr:SET domain-containing protein [Naegleria gruberi]EFC48871.1 SET domain-containing protein [Naegleria gruberi]|eukprot:XP_002681615.1 SET domain-containing protein [Naegleria gruberi strain NEG-M]
MLSQTNSKELSSLIQLKQNDQVGRYYEVVASSSTTSFGKLILHEKPFCFIIDDRERTHCCNYCFKANIKLSRCKACKVSHYCSMNCYHSDHHLKECKALATHPKVTNSIRLLLKCFLSCSDEKQFEMIQNLAPSSSSDEKVEDNLIKLAILFADYVKDVDLSSSFLDNRKEDLDFIYLLLLKLQRNTFSICNEEMNAIGSGIYLKASMFNHSCVPNCAILFDSDKNLYVRILNPSSLLEEGTPLTINYVDLMDLTANRQKKLKEQYHFTCTCPRCLNSNEEVNENVDKMISIANEHRKNQNLQEAVNYFQRIVSKKRSSPSLFHEIYMGIALNSLTHLNVDLSDFKKAYEFGIESLEYFEKYYPPFYPLLGLQYLTCAKLASYLEENGQARLKINSRDLFHKCFAILNTLFRNENNQPFNLLIENNISLP